jgi:hypothetical protein
MLMDFEKSAGLSAGRLALLGLGTLLCLSAAMVSKAGIERAFLGESSGQLAWGPSALRIALALQGLFIITATLIYPKRAAVKDSSYSKPVGFSFGLVAGAAAVVILVLRLYQLNSAMWVDEIYMLVAFAREPVGRIVTTYSSQNQHLLYTVLAHLSMGAFGESAWALRLPAVIFGTLSIGALWLLAKEVTSRTEALLAVALMTVSYHHVWFSQNARGYTGLLFCTLLATWLFLRGLRSDKLGWWVGYAFVIALGIWVHLTMLFTVVAHFLVYARMFLTKSMSERGGRWSPLFGFSLAALSTFVLYSLVLPQMFGGVLGNEHAEHTNVQMWKNPIWTATELLRGLQLGYATWIGALLMLGLFLAGLLSYARSNAVLLELTLWPAVLGTAANVLMHHPLWPRFYFFLMGFGLLIIVRGSCGIGEYLHLPFRVRERAGVFVCLAIIAASALSLHQVYGPKQNLEAAQRFVERSRGTGDRVATAGVATYFYQNYLRAPWLSADTAEQLDQIRESSANTWLLYIFPIQLETDSPGLMADINANFERVALFKGTLRDGDVYVLRSLQSRLRKEQ